MGGRSRREGRRQDLRVLGGDGLGVKCGRDADEAAELRDRFPDLVSVMAYIGRHGWNAVTLDPAIPDDELRELVDDSYAAVVAKLPKRLRPAGS